MGYFGHTGLDNDDALDWIGELGDGVTAAGLRKAFRAYKRFRPRTQKRFTPNQIEENIRLALISDLEDPPRWWSKSGKPLIELLQQTEREVRDDLESGRYLERQYGPVEQALAAAEVVASWGGRPPAKVHPAAKKMLRKLPSGPVPIALLDAIDVVSAVSKNPRYQKMREFYLNAFLEVSGGSDSMAGVKDIIERLRDVKSSMVRT
jgi:hypothetical protein